MKISTRKHLRQLVGVKHEHFDSSKKSLNTKGVFCKDVKFIDAS